MRTSMKMVSVTSLMIHATNSLTPPNPGMVQQLADSMRREGFRPNHPLLVTPDAKQPSIYRILDGKHRFTAAIMAGVEEIPIVIVDVPTDVEAMTATIVDNTFINPVFRKQAKGIRVLITFRKCLDDGALKAPWSLANVNKSDWYAGKAIIEEELAKAKHGLPELPAIQLIDRMIIQPGLSDRIYRLFRDQDAWDTIVKRTADAAPSGNTLKSSELTDAIDALSRYLKVAADSDATLPEDLRKRVRSCLAEMNKSRRNSDAVRTALARACEMTISILAGSGGPQESRLF